MDEQNRENFFKAYAEVPEVLRSQIIVVFNEKIYSWNSVYFEVKNKTDMSRKLLSTLFAMKLI